MGLSVLIWSADRSGTKWKERHRTGNPWYSFLYWLKPCTYSNTAYFMCCGSFQILSLDCSEFPFASWNREKIEPMPMVRLQAYFENTCKSLQRSRSWYYKDQYTQSDSQAGCGWRRKEMKPTARRHECSGGRFGHISAVPSYFSF